MSLGKNILNERKKLKLSQEQLAEKINVTRQTISNWELEETNPTPEQLKNLSKIFNQSIDHLMDNDVPLIEKLVRNTDKQVKFSKIILITIYLLIMILLISFTIYKFTKKDYTDIYQTSFECTTKEGETLEISVDQENQTYIIDVDGDKYLAGNSLVELMDNLNIIKKLFVKNGGTCK